MNALERDALEVLRLVRSLKNSFAPINQIPPEVLSLIPGYLDDDYNDADQELIALTHVCRGWRNTFTSCSSLWTRLDCMDVDKTHTYIQRSQYSPLEICLTDIEDTEYLDDAFSLVVPHLHRLKSLAIYADSLPEDLSHFRCRAPLLEELEIHLYYRENPVLDSMLFDGDLSSLRELTLSRVLTHLPWNNMANLRALNLRSCPSGYDLTQLLDFFESAPLLRSIELEDSIPDAPNVPPRRIVPLPHLITLSITADTPHSVLLNHLDIPIGASLILRFNFGDERSPLLDYLPEACANFKNLSPIIMVNLHFNSGNKFVRLSGPTGSLRVLAHWVCAGRDSYAMDYEILQSLDAPMLSTTQRLAISKYRYPNPNGAEVEESPAFQTLSFTDNLRTLILSQCDNMPFFLALDPEENPSKLILCPNLEELIIYIKPRDWFPIEGLISMVKNRALAGAALPSIAMVCLGEPVPGGEIFKLGEHVAHVACRVGGKAPAWDDIPGKR